MENKFNEIKSCEVCGNKELVSVLNLGAHPMCDDLVEVGDPRECKEYPIEILFCKTCLTAHQRFQVPKHDLFPTSYHYRSRFTADVLNGMKGLVESATQRFGSLRGKIVLDIGCNDGSLLDFFKNEGAKTIGIEPTGAYADAKEKGHITYNNYLDEAIAETVANTHGKVDFITFTNVFAHIENLHEVFASLKKLMAPHTVIIIENHYLGAVLDGKQFDTFYHEHPRTYSYTSFVHMAKSLGVSLMHVEFPSRYGGNIRVFMGKEDGQSSGVDQAKLSDRESHFFENFLMLKKGVDTWLVNKKHFIEDMVKRHGKIKAKAFPGRAAILVKLLGLNSDQISAVYEKPGSLKIGHYLPGTRIPIMSDNDLFKVENKSGPLLNLAWHIPKEIRSYLKDHNYNGEVVDILSSSDFTN